MRPKSVREFMAELEAYGAKAKDFASRGLVGLSDLARTVASQEYSLEGAKRTAKKLQRAGEDAVKGLREQSRTAPGNYRHVAEQVEKITRK